MAISEENGCIPATMLVGPTGYAGGNNSGFGFGGDWAWILLLLLIGGNGWGMGGFGGGMMWPMMMGGMGGFGMDYLYPWLNNSEHISGGFRDQMIQTNIASLGDKITSGFGDVATQLCGGFAGVNAGIANAAAQAEISANSRQMANMNQMFGIQSALQQCCCDNRAGLADLKYTVAMENCADRTALSDGIRDLLAATQAQTQTILTQLCNDKIEQKNDTIAQLRSELMYARGQASQDVQTARILGGQVAEVDALYNRLNSCPVPTTPVYGRTPIFTCGNQQGCGCGNGFAN